MDIEPILGSVAVVGSLLLLWWGVTARPSAAHGNLVAGLAGRDASASSSSMSTALGRLGSATRRRIPHVLVDGLEINLVRAGYPAGLDLPRILGLKVVLAAAPVAVLIINQRYILAPVVGAVVFFAPDYWVISERDKRQNRLRSDIADVVDQLTICVEAGLGFDAALSRVARSTEGPIAEELRHTISDIGAGVPRSQALRAWSDRTQIDEIRQLVAALLQAQKHGVSIADTLRIQAAEMRLKRRQRTEERAAKLPVKLIFPIVACYLPVFMIITMVPALINIFRAL